MQTLHKFFLHHKVLASAVILSIFAVGGGGTLLSHDRPSTVSSSELGIAAFSPAGPEGGAIVPASCATATSCYSGTLNKCHGGADEYAPCTSCNACGTCNSGLSQCGGACSVGPPALPAGYGSGCASVPNACGMTSAGTINCSGRCSAATLSDALCPPTSHSCTGSVPANASMFSGDNIGLTVDTPYTYWSVDTGTRCQYSCNGGYSWNGSACIALPPAPSAPTLSFWADNTSLSYNTATMLHWTTTGGVTSCTASGAWSGSRASLGDSSTGNLTSTQTYNLSCTGPGGSVGPYTVTVAVSGPPATTVDLRVNGSKGPTIQNGATVPVSWTSNGTSCTVLSGINWAGSNNARAANGTNLVTIISPSIYSIRCTGPGGTASDTVNVAMSCIPVTGISYSDCTCSNEKRMRRDRFTDCSESNVTIDCTTEQKNACRDFNWKEVAP